MCVLTIFTLALILMAIPLVSASFFSDFWNKITGNVANTEEDIISADKETVSIGVSGSAPQPALSCCFCAYDDQTDTNAFLRECKGFFEGKENPSDKNFKCDVKEKVAISEWEERFPELMNQYQCAEPLQIHYATHGPACDELIKFIQVCVSNSPTCDLNVGSGSCQTFRHLPEVEAHFTELKNKLGPDITITSCGNRLNGHFDSPACTLTSIVKVSQKELSITPGLCKPVGASCSPADEVPYDCINAQSQKTTQRCCRNAESLSKYTLYEENSGSTLIGSTGFSVEGGSCQIPPCAQQGEKCANSGIYSCRSSNGLITTQSCCRSGVKNTDTKVFSTVGESCQLPSCVDIQKDFVSCDSSGRRIDCKDAQGEDSFQVCCGMLNEKNQYLYSYDRTKGFLSSAGTSCNCTLGFNSNNLKNACLLDGKKYTRSDTYCVYTKAPSGTFCGSFKDNTCNEQGECSSLTRKECVTPSDCYNGGKEYCWNNPESREAALLQKCMKGFCIVDFKKFCKQNQQCIETDKGASCIRQKTSKTKRSRSLFDDLFSTEDTEVETA